MDRWAAVGMRDVNAVGFPEPTDLNQLCYIAIRSAWRKKIFLQANICWIILDEAFLAWKTLISSP